MTSQGVALGAGGARQKGAHGDGLVQTRQCAGAGASRGGPHNPKQSPQTRTTSSLTKATRRRADGRRVSSIAPSGAGPRQARSWPAGACRAAAAPRGVTALDVTSSSPTGAGRDTPRVCDFRARRLIQTSSPERFGVTVMSAPAAPAPAPLKDEAAPEPLSAHDQEVRDREAALTGKSGGAQGAS